MCGEKKSFHNFLTFFYITFIIIFITWIIEGTVSFLLQESVMQCYNVIQDIAREDYESIFKANSSSGTPVNVLDEHFLSLESEKTNGTNVAAPTIQEKDFKRRKVTDYGSSTVQFSHFH